MNIGEKLRAIRESQNLSLRQLQNLTEKNGHRISHTTIARTENGFDFHGTAKGSVQIEDLRILCKCLKYPFRQFLEEAGYIEPADVALPSIMKKYVTLTDELKSVADGIIGKLYDDMQRQSTGDLNEIIVKKSQKA